MFFGHSVDGWQLHDRNWV